MLSKFGLLKLPVPLLVQTPVLLVPTILPLKATVLNDEQIVKLGTTVSVACLLMSTCTVSRTGKQKPLLVEVRYKSTTPNNKSVVPGIYPVVKELTDVNVPLPVELHVPVLVEPIMLAIKFKDCVLQMVKFGPAFTVASGARASDNICVAAGQTPLLVELSVNSKADNVRSAVLNE